MSNGDDTPKTPPNAFLVLVGFVGGVFLALIAIKMIVGALSAVWRGIPSL